MGHSRIVLQTVKEHELYSKKNKCEFLLRSMNFLGHIISGKEVEVDRSKMEVVKHWPRPLTPTDHGFSRLVSEVCGWFSIHCVSFDYFDLKE